MSDRVKIAACIIGFAALTALAFMWLGMMIGYQRGVSRFETLAVERDTVTVTDTLVIDRFETDTVWNERLVPYYVAVDDPVTPVDSAWVTLPIEWHHLSVPDTADIWYSGFAAGIDSVRFYVPTRYVSEKVTVTEWETPRLTLDVGAGAMWHEDKANPYIIGEMRYNARKTTFAAFGAMDHEGRWGAGLNVTYRFNILK